MKNYIHTTVSLSIAQIKSMMRNWIYVFYMIALPALFLLVFGMVYASGNTSKWNIAIFNNAKSSTGKSISEEILKSVMKTSDNKDGVFEKVEVKDFEEAQTKMVRGEIDAIIQIPDNFGEISQSKKPAGQIEVIYNKTSNNTGAIVSGIFQNILTKVDDQMGREKANFTIKAVESNKNGLRTFDYVFSGLLAYVVMTFGLIGLSNVVPQDKESGALKRVHASPVSAGQYLLSYIASFMILSVISFAIMFFIAFNIFNLKMNGNWFNLIVFILASLIMMFGTGLIVGGISKDDKQASGLSNIVMFPMMFLSGVFIPRFLMPDLFQKITDFIPLTPVNDGMRLIITENYSLVQVVPQLVLIGIWTIVLYIIAVKSFRWE